MTTQFSINGKPYTVDLTTLPIDISLNTFIREHAGLPATKFMCQEGGCGVCVCAVTGKHPASGEVHTWAVNSCLTLLNSCTDLAITTAEGIGNKRNGYHAIQKRLAKMNGTQCGYCTPGFVMNMYALLQANGGKLTMEEVENSFGGNICRCTGYRPILDAMKSFAVDSNISIPDECRDIEDLAQKTCPKTGEKCSGSCGSAKRSALSYADGGQWYWAKTLGDIFDAFAKLGKAPYTLIAGNTAHGVYRRTPEIKHYVDINGVATLSGHTLTSSSLTLGGNLSLTETMEIFKEAAKKPGFEYCQQLWQHFDLIANVPVRNSGTLAGNLAIKHQHPEFPSDIYIVFEALAVQVILNVSASEQTTISLNEFLQTPLEKKIISGFVLRNYPREKYIFGSYKIMPRAQNAHAYVNAAFLVNIEKPSNRVISSRICFGGIDADYVHAVHIEKLLAGKSLFGNDVATQIFSGLQQSLKATVSLPDASPEYRQLLAHGLLYKFLLANAPKVAETFKSGGELLKRPVSSGKQTYETIEKSFPITKPTIKHEGLLQTSGEAAFANDLPAQANQVWGAFVSAKKVGATVTNIDTTAALKVPGVVAFFSAKDIPGANSVTINMPLFFPADEELFLTGVVKFYNQPVGVIVAESNALANRAAELVELTYQGGSSEVLPTLEDVLGSACADRIDHSAKSTIKELKFKSDKVDITGKGKLDMGLQYHYYMEPQTTVVVPFEGALQVHSSTQWMDLVQTVIGNLVKMNYNEVQVKTRRLGGGYGGKATNCLPAACAAALAAFKLNRPVRFVQTLESMMDTLGKRWPCLVNYDFHVQKNGKIVALQTSFWEDAGHNSNGSPMGHTQLLSKNCYEFSDNFKLDGYMVFTDSPSNCACRAPGSVEGIAIIESIIEHIAFETGLDPLEVRIANLLPGHKMHQMLPRFIDSTKYKERRPQIESFNEKNRWRKRGLGLCVMEYHMGYFGQYPATVAIYHGDGTVIVSHGGIEMGQGLNTKVAQVIAHDLGIPIELIRVEGSNTLNGANSMVTGGSIGSEQLCFSGTLAGNLAIKHQHPEFPSDIYIVFEALAVQVILNVSASEQTTISLNEFLQTPLEKKIISGFVLRNYPREKYIFGSYKIMPRAQNAHAYVNAAFLVNIVKPSNRVISSRICFGGIDADYVHAVHIEKLLAGKSLFGNDVATQIFSGLQQSLKATVSPPDASPEYRQLLAHGLLYKFLLANAPKVAEPFKSGGELLKRPVSSGKQTYETIEKSFPVTKPTIKHEGLLQTSGEAAFANDLPAQANQVWGAFVSAKKVGATVTNIDATAALKVPGVVAFFSAKDIPGANSLIINMPLFFPADEELFLTGAVKFYNQPVGVIVAESNALANRAAELVELTYEGGSSEILATLEDVLGSACADRIDHSAKSTIKELKFKSDKVDITGKGKLDMGLQYHFFMEPQTTVVVPFEGALQVHCSTQWMDFVQTIIGNLVKMNYNEVQVKTRRIGGGYGGKVTNAVPVACAAALAAYKLNRPVRFVQSLESMMDMLGKRWPCLVNYDFHVQKNGKIVALQTSFWEDGGHNANFSPLGHTQLLSKNVYEFSDNFKLDGYIVLTDSPSNCACRAPGSVEGIAIIENIIEHIAFETGLDPLEVRVANLLPGHKMHQMLPRFIDSTKYKERRPQIESFNEKNRWRKRGLGLCVMEYHMGYFGQYPATVAIYHGDGTVIVSHGGIEMGQGLNTKVAQVIAHDLGIPIELIRVEGSNTLNGANSMVTGGSIGSEQLCFAVRNCCNTLNARLKPVKESLKDASWKQLVETAYEQKVNLLASDYCKQDDMNPYTVCALGLMEVEVDILTGNYQLTRVDILEDAGESLNPSVDIGQIEGAFVMGLGYWTSEQCVVDKRTGALLTNRTWNYKPPGAKDIPIDFRIEMLPNSANTAGFMRSKATGEPAICLSVGITFALEHALQSARKDAGLPKSWIPLSAPMTPEVVLLNAGHSASQFKLE